MREAIGDALSEQVVDIFRLKVKKKFRDRVALDARIQADLGLDSLGILSIMLVAEQELGIAVFPLQADVDEIRTVGDIVKVVRSLREKRAAG